MVMAGYTPAAFAPMQATYQNWLQSRLGTAPLAQAYGASFRPYAELAYLSNPVSGIPGYQEQGGAGAFVPGTGFEGAGVGWSPSTAVNPYQAFLNQGGGFSPLSTSDWMQRARNVQTTLEAQGDDLTEGQLRVQERFGTGDQATERQRQLAQAPIVTQSPFALRGETQNILNRLYNDWMVNQPATAAGQDPTGYLQHAMNNLWGRFGVV